MLNELKECFLEECDDDHVGLWSLIKDVRYYFPNSNDQDVKKITLSVISEYLNSGKIVAGIPADNGRDFIETDLKTQSILEFIDKEWTKLKRDPNIGEIIWFTTPL